MARRLTREELGSVSQNTRIKREGMPNGFFLNDLLWFGDCSSEQTAVSRGFFVEPAEMNALDKEAKSDLLDRLRYLLAALGEEYTLQCRHMVCSDYSEVLERYGRAISPLPLSKQLRNPARRSGAIS